MGVTVTNMKDGRKMISGGDRFDLIFTALELILNFLEYLTLS